MHNSRLDGSPARLCALYVPVIRPRHPALLDFCRSRGLRTLSEERAVDRSVAHLNIERYRRLLAEETDEKKRRVLIRLLEEEEAKLSSLPPRSPSHKPDH